MTWLCGKKAFFCLQVCFVTVATQNCVSNCKHFFSDWIRKHATGAHVSDGNGLKHITMKMQSILEHNKQCLFIDVGAASYGNENSQDYSDSLIFLEHTTTCKGFAFEIIPEEAERLKNKSQRYKDRIEVINMGVSNTSGQMFVHNPEGRQSHNTYTLKYDRQMGRRSGQTISTTTLDTFHESVMGAKHVNYIKVDSEGYDPVIAQGMTRILTNKNVDVISFEYAIGWDRLFEKLTRHGNMHNDQHHGQHASHIIGELQQSLRSFQSYLSAFGYETFMIVGNPKTPRFDDMTQDVTIVPIFGAMWDDWYELCLHTCQYHHCWHCWTDILVMNPKAEFARALKSELLLRGKEHCYDIKLMESNC